MCGTSGGGSPDGHWCRAYCVDKGFGVLRRVLGVGSGTCVGWTVSTKWVISYLVPSLVLSPSPLRRRWVTSAAVQRDLGPGGWFRLLGVPAWCATPSSLPFQPSNHIGAPSVTHSESTHGCKPMASGTVRGIHPPTRLLGLARAGKHDCLYPWYPRDHHQGARGSQAHT